MMDIVERLRKNCTCNFESTPCGAEEECRNAFEGADEIERLRMRVDFEKKYRNDALDELKKQDDEIERLRKALQTICDGQRDADKSYAELFAEVKTEARDALKEVR